MCVCARVDLIFFNFFLPLSERNLAFICTFQVFCHLELQSYACFLFEWLNWSEKTQCGFLPSSSEGPTLPRLSCKKLAGRLLLLEFLLIHSLVFKECC